MRNHCRLLVFFFQAEDGIRAGHVTGVQTCALPICRRPRSSRGRDAPPLESGKAGTQGRRGPASQQYGYGNTRRLPPVNTDELESALMRAELRVLEIQTKLHRWARDDPHRRFDDLFNLVADPAFLLVAWDRVRGNKGARTAGVDGRTAASIQGQGVGEFLDGLRASLKDRSFRPLPVRERMIPKAGGKLRRLGIATVPAYC